MRIIIISALMFLGSRLSACDVCASSTAVNSLGILPNQSRHFVSVGSSLQVFKNTMSGAPASTDKLLTTDISIRISLSKKWQIIGTLPMMQLFRKSATEQYHTTQCIRDAQIGAAYALYNKKNKKGTNYFVQATVQVILPTGKTNIMMNNEKLPRAIQGGNLGSDLSAQGIITYKNGSGVIVSLGERVLSENEQFYQQGIVSNISATYYRKRKLKNVSCMAFAGLHYQHATKDKNAGYNVKNTGSEIIKIPITLQIVLKKMLLSASNEVPIIQNINQKTSTLATSANLRVAYLF
jgi:hypothetical protein